jgi:excisionase family DNA binding protein
MTATDANEFLTTEQVARWLQVSEASLTQDRRRKRGIPYVKIGGRRIRYRRQDVLDFIETNTNTE